MANDATINSKAAFAEFLASIDINDTQEKVIQSKSPKRLFENKC